MISIFLKHSIHLKLCLVELLSRLSITKRKDCNVWPKLPLVFNNYPLLRLFKLTATSLINSCPAQKKKQWYSLFLRSFLPALICMHIFTLRGFTWLLAWKYVTICNISSIRAAMFFFSSQKNKSCMRSICAAIYTEVSGDFHDTNDISFF